MDIFFLGGGGGGGVGGGIVIMHNGPLRGMHYHPEDIGVDIDRYKSPCKGLR